MPVILIYGFSDPMSRRLEEFTEALINTAVCSVAELKLKASDVSCFYPRDWMAKGLGEELVVFVDGLMDKPERTEEVRNRLAASIVETINHFFPEVSLIECFIRPFNLKQGFCSKRLVKKVDASAFPKTLELGGYSKEELINVIIGQGCKIAPQALSMILQDAFVTLTEKKTVTLCRKTVSEMGFTDDLTPWHRIANWIKRNGKLCDYHELALMLRIIYQDQPVGEELLIANKFQFFRVTNFEGEKSVFRNGMDGFQSNLILRENDPAENDTVLYRLNEEFVYCEK